MNEVGLAVLANILPETTKLGKSLAKNLTRCCSFFWFLASSFCFPASGFWLLASSFQLPASSFQLAAYGFPLLASNFQLPASRFQLPTSGFQLPASSFQFPASGFPRLASGFQLPSSRPASGLASGPASQKTFSPRPGSFNFSYTDLLRTTSLVANPSLRSVISYMYFSTSEHPST